MGSKVYRAYITNLYFKRIFRTKPNSVETKVYNKSTYIEIRGVCRESRASDLHVTWGGHEKAERRLDSTVNHWPRTRVCVHVYTRVKGVISCWCHVVGLLDSGLRWCTVNHWPRNSRSASDTCGTVAHRTPGAARPRALDTESIRWIHSWLYSFCSVLETDKFARIRSTMARRHHLRLFGNRPSG